MYIHLLWSQTISYRHRGFRDPPYGLFHALPARIPKFLPQPMFCLLPVWLGRRQLSLSSPRQAKQALPPVFSTLDANPRFLPEKAQRPCQCRTIHREAGTQQFLVSLSGRRQRRQQPELSDLNTRLSQFLVINPRYDSRKAPQVLARTGQRKKCVCGLLSKSFGSHLSCIYIFSFCLSNAPACGRETVRKGLARCRTALR